MSAVDFAAARLACPQEGSPPRSIHAKDSSLLGADRVDQISHCIGLTTTKDGPGWVGVGMRTPKRQKMFSSQVDAYSKGVNKESLYCISATVIGSVTMHCTMHCIG